jgi:hypothetical protein
MHCAHFSHYTLSIPCAARSPSVYGVENALRISHTIHSIPCAARSPSVYGVENALRISHTIHSIPCAAALAFCVWCGKCAQRAFFHTIHSLSLARQSRIALLTNTGGARLLECMVWKMRCANFPHHTLHPLRGEGARTLLPPDYNTRGKSYRKVLDFRLRICYVYLRRTFA